MELRMDRFDRILKQAAQGIDDTDRASTHIVFNGSVTFNLGTQQAKHEDAPHPQCGTCGSALTDNNCCPYCSHDRR